MITVQDVIHHCRDREYMSGLARDQTRIKATSEVFTPTPLVRQILKSFVDVNDIHDNFFDPACGDGQILSEILILKMQHGADFKTALSSIYGADLMMDNVFLCRDRLLCGQTDLIEIVQQNIVGGYSTLEHDYTFKKPTKARLKEEKEIAYQQHCNRLGILL